MLLALIVLTGCRTATAADDEALGILVGQIPDLPEIPAWPEVNWSYENGKYCLVEEDVDKVLDYLENRMPLYRFEMEQFGEQLRIVLDGISSIK